MSLDNVFRCDQGAADRWFFVPRVGRLADVATIPELEQVGGSARLTGPTGEHPIVNTQPGDRIGFQLPTSLDTPGTYRLVVDAVDDVVVYEIDVLPVPTPEDPPDVQRAKLRALDLWPRNRS